MKVILFSVLLAVLPAQVQAQDLRAAATKFCDSARQINNQGLSAAPGSFTGNVIAKKASQTHEQYQTLWAVAKSLGIHSCQVMW